jgi:hypothetical protein
MFERRRRKFLPTENFDSCGVFEVGVVSASGFGSATPLMRLADGGPAGAFEVSGTAKEAVLPGATDFFEGVVLISDEPGDMMARFRF